MRTALDTFAVPGGRLVRRGEVVADDDPVLEGREALFSASAAPAEQTTAAPGERRNTRRSAGT